MLIEAFLNSGLSRREAEVATLVGRGLSNKDTASALFVTEKTVKFHLTNVFRKLKIKNRVNLVLWSAPHLQFEEKIVMQKKARADEPLEMLEISGDKFKLPFGGIKSGNT